MAEKVPVRRFTTGDGERVEVFSASQTQIEEQLLEAQQNAERLQQKMNILLKLADLVEVRGDSVQINGLLAVKGDIEFKGVQFLVGDGSPLGTQAPIGSLYLRRDGGAGTIVYDKYGAAATDWEDLA